jgi:hypothetical protein
VASDQFTRLLDFLRRLDDAQLSHRLVSIRPDSVCVEVDVPGERWEIDMAAWDIQVERFRSDGEVSDEHALEVLFTDFAD